MRLVRISLLSRSCIKISPKQLSELRGTDFPEGKTFKGMSELSGAANRQEKLEGFTGTGELQREGRREHQGTYRYSGALVQHRAEEIIHIVIQAYRGPQVISKPWIWEQREVW